MGVEDFERCAGFFYHTANLQANGSYKTVKNPQTVHLHPSSGLMDVRPCVAASLIFYLFICFICFILFQGHRIRASENLNTSYSRIYPPPPPPNRNTKNTTREYEDFIPLPLSNLL